MLSSQFQEMWKPAKFLPAMLWASMTGSIVVFVVLSQFAARSGSLNPSSPDEMLIYALGAMAVSSAVISLGIPHFMLSDQRLLEFLRRPFDATKIATNPQTGKRDEQRLAKLHVLNADEQRLLALSGFFIGPFVVRLAVNESVAIYGFVLSMHFQRPDLIFPFAVASLMLNVLSYPKMDQLAVRGLELLRNSPRKAA